MPHSATRPNAVSSTRERFLEAIIESAADYAIISLDLDGLVTSWNAGAEKVLGWSAAEICGRPASVFFTHEDREHGIPLKEMTAALECGRGSDERWHLKKDGTCFWASGEMMPLRGESGVEGFVKILRDRTEQRQADQRVRDSEAFLRSVLGSSGDCIKVLDLDGRLRFMNDGGKRILEVDDFSKLEGCVWADLWEGDGRAAAHQAVEEARAGRSGRFTQQGKTAKGTLKWWDVQITPIPGPDGRPERLLSISRDVSEEHAGKAAMQNQVTRLALLSDASAKLISGADPDEVIAGLFRATAEQLDLDTCFHFTATKTGDLRLQSYIGVTPVVAASLDQLEFGQAVCGTVAQEQTPRYFPHVQHASDPMLATVRDLGLTAYACNPLVADGRLLGTLSFGSRRRSVFAEDDLAFLRTVSNHVAAIKERNRAEGLLRESEERWRGLFERMQEGFFVGDAVRDAAGGIVDIRFLELNPVFERLTGLTLADTIGRTIREAIPTIQDELIQTYAHVIETGEPRTFEVFIAGLGNRWYEARARRDQANRVVVLFLDITERKRAAEDLAASEQRSRLAQEAGHVGTFEVDIATAILTGSDEFFRLWGLVPQGSVPASLFEQAVIPEDRERVSNTSGRKAGTSPKDVEYRIRRADTGELRWIARRAEYLRNGEGRPARLVGTAHDITEAKHAEARRVALIELGDRLRDLTATAAMAHAAAELMGRTLGVCRAGYGTTDPVRETITIERDWAAPGLDGLAGTLHFADYGSYIDDLKRGEIVVIEDAATDPRTAARADALAAIDACSIVNLPLMEHGRFVAVFYLTHQAARVWTAEELLFIRNVADRTRAAVERLRAEDRQRLLNAELSHRLKNTLSMVQAIIAQTLRTAPDMETAKQALADRMVALGRAHDILLRGEREAADARDLIVSSTSLHSDGRPERFRLSGPKLVVGSRAALSLALMLHELATNATKYGALSTQDGFVEISWSTHAHEGEALLRFTWTERGGPPVLAPSRRGFGSRLIERGLAGQIGGTVTLNYDPDGVVCTLEAALSAFQADEVHS